MISEILFHHSIVKILTFARSKKQGKMTLHHTLTTHIQKAVLELFNISIEKVEFQATRKEFEGDITMVVFPLVKALKGNPVEIGNQIGNYLVANVNEVAKFNVVGGFLNIVISDAF